MRSSVAVRALAQAIACVLVLGLCCAFLCVACGGPPAPDQATLDAQAREADARDRALMDAERDAISLPELAAQPPDRKLRVRVWVGVMQPDCPPCPRGAACSACQQGYPLYCSAPANLRDPARQCADSMPDGSRPMGSVATYETLGPFVFEGTTQKTSRGTVFAVESRRALRTGTVITQPPPLPGYPRPDDAFDAAALAAPAATAFVPPPPPPPPPTCAVLHAQYTDMALEGCTEGTPPTSVSDLEISLEPTSLTVVAGAALTMTLRVKNRTTHTLLFAAAPLAGEDLIVSKVDGPVIAPPRGSPPPDLPNPICARVDCAPERIEASPSVSLLPNGVLEWRVVWKASRMAWPPPQKRSCCSFRATTPVAVGPLPRGKYRLVASFGFGHGEARFSSAGSVIVEVR